MIPPKLLTILRGAPGSGKTTLAKKLLEGFAKPGAILSTDDYWRRGGVYRFAEEELGKAHAWNQGRAAALMGLAGYPHVIIDNTNMALWEFTPYIELAKKYEYQVQVGEPEMASWQEVVVSLAHVRERAGVFAGMNKHGVPFDQIMQMLVRYASGFNQIPYLEQGHLDKFIAENRPPWEKVEEPDEDPIDYEGMEIDTALAEAREEKESDSRDA